jgi:hypothetical protein
MTKPPVDEAEGFRDSSSPEILKVTINLLLRINAREIPAIPTTMPQTMYCGHG